MEQLLFISVAERCMPGLSWSVLRWKELGAWWQPKVPSQPQLSHCSSVPQAGKDTSLSVALWSSFWFITLITPLWLWKQDNLRKGNIGSSLQKHFAPSNKPTLGNKGRLPLSCYAKAQLATEATCFQGTTANSHSEKNMSLHFPSPEILKLQLSSRVPKWALQYKKKQALSMERALCRSWFWGWLQGRW